MKLNNYFKIQDDESNIGYQLQDGEKIQDVLLAYIDYLQDIIKDSGLKKQIEEIIEDDIYCFSTWLGIHATEHILVNQTIDFLE